MARARKAKCYRVAVRAWVPGGYLYCRPMTKGQAEYWAIRGDATDPTGRAYGPQPAIRSAAESTCTVRSVPLAWHSVKYTR